MSRDSLRQFVERSHWRMTLLLVVGVLLIVIGAFVWFWQPGQQVHFVRVTGGVEGLNRHRLAEYLKRHASAIELAVEIVPCEGTSEATSMVQRRQVDMALVNGLLRSPQADSVRHVATLSIEALHLLVKREFVESVKADFGELRGLSVNLGPPGSETDKMARALLSFCEIDLGSGDGSDESLVDRQTLEELLDTLDQLEKAGVEDESRLRDRLPDVLIHVSALPSPLARRLIRLAKYGLVPVPFADAFSRISVDEEDLDRDHVDQVHVVTTSIPFSMYGATPTIPAATQATLGCPLILIVHEDLPSEIVARMLPHIYDGPVARVCRPPPIGSVPPVYPLHPAAIAYRHRDEPIVRSDLVEFAQRIFGLIAPLTGGFLALYGYYRWRQTLRFTEYFAEFQAMDIEAKGLANDDIVTPAEAEQARRLEAQLTRLQQRAVADFCRNRLQGEGVLVSFLHLLAETRGFLRFYSESTTSPRRDSETARQEAPQKAGLPTIAGGSD